jgi:hypothetical protein
MWWVRSSWRPQPATECVLLIESIGDPALVVGLLTAPMLAKYQAGEVVETLRLAQRVIDLADGDVTMGNVVSGSPLASALVYRGCARMSLGMPRIQGALRRSPRVSPARGPDQPCNGRHVQVQRHRPRGVSAR